MENDTLVTIFTDKVDLTLNELWDNWNKHVDETVYGRIENTIHRYFYIKNPIKDFGDGVTLHKAIIVDCPPVAPGSFLFIAILENQICWFSDPQSCVHLHLEDDGKGDLFISFSKLKPVHAVLSSCICMYSDHPEVFSPLIYIRRYTEIIENTSFQKFRWEAKRQLKKLFVELAGYYNDSIGMKKHYYGFYIMEIAIQLHYLTNTLCFLCFHANLLMEIACLTIQKDIMDLFVFENDLIKEYAIYTTYHNVFNSVVELTTDLIECNVRKRTKCGKMVRFNLDKEGLKKYKEMVFDYERREVCNPNGNRDI